MVCGILDLVAYGIIGWLVLDWWIAYRGKTPESVTRDGTLGQIYKIFDFIYAKVLNYK